MFKKVNWETTRLKARRATTRPQWKSKWAVKVKSSDGEDWLKEDLWIDTWINTYFCIQNMPQPQNIPWSKHKGKGCPTSSYVKICEETWPLCVASGFSDFTPTQHWVGAGQKEISFCFFNLHMKKSGLHLKISSLLILTLLIFMKLYQEVVDFNTVAPTL